MFIFTPPIEIEIFLYTLVTFVPMLLLGLVATVYRLVGGLQVKKYSRKRNIAYNLLLYGIFLGVDISATLFLPSLNWEAAEWIWLIFSWWSIMVSTWLIVKTEISCGWLKKSVLGISVLHFIAQVSYALIFLIIRETQSIYSYRKPVVQHTFAITLMLSILVLMLMYRCRDKEKCNTK